MKTKLLFALFALVVGAAGAIHADYLGIRQATDQIVVPLNEPLNTSGVPGVPDSAYVSTYLGTGTAAQYSANSTTYPFSSISIDTTKYLTDTLYWFVDDIADIDGAATGNYLLYGIVTLWTDDLPTHTTFSVQVTGSDLGTALAYLDASVSSAQPVFTTGQRDSVLAALADANIADKVWDALASGHTTVGTFGDYLDAEVSGLGAGVWNTTQRDSILNALADASIASKVWDATQTSYETIGTMGDQLDPDDWTTTAQIADAVWDEVMSGHTTAGTAGDYLDAEVSGVTSVWTTTTRDSVLNAILDASWTAKTWTADALTASVIAADAIGASEIATDAIGTLEIATDAIGSDEIASGAISSSEIATDAIGASELAADAVDEIWDEPQSGHATAGTFGLYLDQAVSTLGGSSVWTSGQRDSVLNAILDASWTAKTWTSGALTAAVVATDAIDADAVAANAATEIQAGLATSASISSLPSAADNADAVWDEVQSGHTTAGTFGLYLDQAVSTLGGSGVWTSGQRDSVLNAILDASWTAKTWTSGAITSTVMATDAITSDEISSTAVTELQSGLATTAIITALSAKIDSVAWYAEALFQADKKLITRYNADADTVFVMNLAGSDTTGYTVFFHPSQTAGYPPDSMKFYQGAP